MEPAQRSKLEFCTSTLPVPAPKSSSRCSTPSSSSTPKSRQNASPSWRSNLATPSTFLRAASAYSCRINRNERLRWLRECLLGTSPLGALNLGIQRPHLLDQRHHLHPVRRQLVIGARRPRLL